MKYLDGKFPFSKVVFCNLTWDRVCQEVHWVVRKIEDSSH